MEFFHDDDTLLLLELCSADAAPTGVGVVSGRTPLCHGNPGFTVMFGHDILKHTFYFMYKNLYIFTDFFPALFCC